MTRKACRRKHYALTDTMQIARVGAAYVTDEMISDEQTAELMAIERFFAGAATRQDWSTVADLNNIAETMAAGGHGVEVAKACEAVGQALSESHARYTATGRIGMTGPQLQALRDLWDYYNLQRKTMTARDYVAWRKKTADRIRSAHPSLKVFINPPQETA